MNFKKIHIGNLIEQRVKETEIDTLRICKFFSCTEKEIFDMYESENLHSNIIMKWCKFLEYDFFRIYSQHIILYAPIDNEKYEKLGLTKSSLPHFRKNLYTMEIIEFILELLNNGEKTKIQIMSEYNIPKTTLYKWIQKYNVGDKSKS